MTAMQMNQPDHDKLKNQQAPDWDDTPELEESADNETGNDSWWGPTQISAAIRDARRQQVDPRKIFNSARGGDEAGSLKFPEMGEAKRPTPSLVSRLIKRFFRSK